MTDVAEQLPGQDSSEYRRAIVARAGGQRDIADTTRRLTAWLEDRLGGPVEIRDFRTPQGAGIANETWLIDAEASGELHRLVVRVEPTQVQIFPDPDFEGLYRLLDTLASEGLVRVPPVHWFESDTSVIGSRFLVMGLLDGRVPITEPPYASHGFVAEATSAERRTLWESAVTELARVHLVPGELVSFIGWPQYGETGEDQQLGYWENYREWVGIELDDRTAELAGWIMANRPHDPGVALSWGDARLGNMIFGDDHRLLGVLDWDQMSLASAGHDLAWWLLFDEVNTTYKGLARPDGFGDRQETIDLWESVAGRALGDISWHEAYTCYKLILITTRTMGAAGYPPERLAASTGLFVKLGRDFAGLA
ncbi:MAG: phosphotransferase family protein [Acidimicrobiales bacterium]|nr:phosphotransferase family protein [Acidimicrobiales bacterium]